MADLAKLISPEILTATVTRAAAAKRRVDGFENETATSAWTGLGRSDVADRLRELVDTPAKVNQGALGLCGPAAFMYCFLCRDPVRFVETAFSLYDGGQAIIGNITLAPGSKLKSQDYTGVAVPAMSKSKNVANPVCGSAEWMFLCSVQDLIKSGYSGLPDGADMWSSEGVGMQDLMSLYQSSGLYKNVVLQTADRVNWNEVRTLRALAPSSSKDVILGVNSKIIQNQPDLLKLLGTNAQYGWNHYVVLNKQVAADKNDPTSLSLDVWSWGGNYPMTTPASMVVAYFYGAIVAEVYQWPPPTPPP